MCDSRMNRPKPLVPITLKSHLKSFKAKAEIYIIKPILPETSPNSWTKSAFKFSILLLECLKIPLELEASNDKTIRPIVSRSFDLWVLHTT